MEGLWQCVKTLILCMSMMCRTRLGESRRSICLDMCQVYLLVLTPNIFLSVSPLILFQPFYRTSGDTGSTTTWILWIDMDLEFQSCIASIGIHSLFEYYSPRNSNWKTFYSLVFSPLTFGCDWVHFKNIVL